MYNVTIINNYIYDLILNTGETIAKNGGTEQLQNWGSHIINVPGMGSINCIDLGDTKFPEYPLKETWGALFRYRSEEIYYRYEGQGQVKMTLDRLGSLTVSTNFSAIVISLPDLIINNEQP